MDSFFSVIELTDFGISIILSELPSVSLTNRKALIDRPESPSLFPPVGSNLNQIAHHYNGGGVRSREMYERTRRAISELYAMKYEVEKMGGEFRGYSEAYRRKKQ